MSAEVSYRRGTHIVFGLVGDVHVPFDDGNIFLLAGYKLTPSDRECECLHFQRGIALSPTCKW